MKNVAKWCVVGMVGFLCLGFGGTQRYSDSVGGKKPPAKFSLKKGRRAFQAIVSDGKAHKKQLVTRLCFRDNTYEDCARDEGDTYIEGNRKGTDIQTTLKLDKLKSIEVLKSNGSPLKVKEKNSGEVYFRVKVTFSTGKKPEVFMINPRLAVAFHSIGVGDERSYLHKIDKIENIRPESPETTARLDKASASAAKTAAKIDAAGNIIK